MSPTAPPQPAQASFHRFRLSDFQRPENPTSSPAGQCSRFRVSDFVPYGSTTSDVSNQSGPQINGSHSVSTSNTATQRSNQPNRQQNIPSAAGSYQVLHMDIEVSPPHHTSNQVAAAGGRGVLHKVPIQKVPAAQLQTHPPPSPLNVANNQQRPIVPAPAPSTMPPIPAPPPAAQPQFTPSHHTEEVRNELSRIVTNIRAAPVEFSELVVNALFAAPSLTENSLLQQIGALYPIPQVATPVPIPVPPQGTESETPVKRKRGRPPTKKHAAASNLIAAPQPASNNMGSPLITVIPARKDRDAIQTCTRCLKPFNPADRPGPLSDPNHGGTCAVRHPYSDYRSGLVTSLTPRGKRSSVKPTWRWKCCGREIQSTSDDPNLQFPREEDDKTGGWCFVGKHTTDPGVREKLGLKQGKGKTIDEVADIGSDITNGGEGGPTRKRTKLNTNHAINNNNIGHAVQAQQHPEERGPSISIPGNTTAAENSGSTTATTGSARPAMATRRRSQIPADVHQNWMSVVQPMQHAQSVSVQPQSAATQAGESAQHAQHTHHALTTTTSPITTHHQQSSPMPTTIIPKLADTTGMAETAEIITPLKRKRGRPKGSKSKPKQPSVSSASPTNPAQNITNIQNQNLNTNLANNPANQNPHSHPSATSQNLPQMQNTQSQPGPQNSLPHVNTNVPTLNTNPGSHHNTNHAVSPTAQLLSEATDFWPYSNLTPDDSLDEVVGGVVGGGIANVPEIHNNPINSLSPSDTVVQEAGLGISEAQLGMLVSATAAMGGGDPSAGSGRGGEVSSNSGGNGSGIQKRGRGRPKGVKNGAGKAAMEKRRLEEEAAQARLGVVRNSPQQQQMFPTHSTQVSPQVMTGNLGIRQQQQQQQQQQTGGVIQHHTRSPRQAGVAGLVQGEGLGLQTHPSHPSHPSHQSHPRQPRQPATTHRSPQPQPQPQQSQPQHQASLQDIPQVPQVPQVPQQEQEQEQEQDTVGIDSISAGAGGGWFPGDDPGWQFA